MSSRNPLQSINQEWREHFRIAEDLYGLPRGFLEAVARQESNFNPRAESHAGAQGLMQIVPRWHPDVDPWDPEESIYYAGKIFRDYLDEFGSTEAALAAYNAGETVTRRYLNEEGRLPPFPETQEYIERITGFMGERESTPAEAAGTSAQRRIQESIMRAMEEAPSRRPNLAESVERRLEVPGGVSQEVFADASRMAPGVGDARREPSFPAPSSTPNRRGPVGTSGALPADAARVAPGLPAPFRGTPTDDPRFSMEPGGRTPELPGRPEASEIFPGVRMPEGLIHREVPVEAQQPMSPDTAPREQPAREEGGFDPINRIMEQIRRRGGDISQLGGMGPTLLAAGGTAARSMIDAVDQRLNPEIPEGTISATNPLFDVLGPGGIRSVGKMSVRGMDGVISRAKDKVLQILNRQGLNNEYQSAKTQLETLQAMRARQASKEALQRYGIDEPVQAFQSGGSIRNFNEHRIADYLSQIEANQDREAAMKVAELIKLPENIPPRPTPAGETPGLFGNLSEGLQNRLGMKGKNKINDGTHPRFIEGIDANKDVPPGTVVAALPKDVRKEAADLGFNVRTHHWTDSRIFENDPVGPIIAGRDPGGAPRPMTHSGTAQSARDRGASVGKDRTLRDTSRTIPLNIRGPFLQMTDMQANSPYRFIEAIDKFGILDAETMNAIRTMRAYDHVLAADLGRRALLREGIRGIRYENIAEDVGRHSYMILDSSDARVPWARFNPAEAGLPGLMRGIAPLLGAGGAAAAAGASDEGR